MRTIQDMEIADKKVFVRVDFNVPLDSRQQITDDTRIKGALPTLETVLAQQARLIIASHLGRPKGEVVEKYSLRPVAERLGRLLGTDIQMAPDCVGAQVQSMVDRMSAGDVLLLENLRFHPQEEENDDAFAAGLAELCDVYVNDAFAVCHRANASVVAITRHVKNCGAGLLLARELAYFAQAMTTPRRPLAAVVGGAKVSSKLAALENMLQFVDAIIIGGAMANTFLKCSGHDVGASMVEADMVQKAAAVIAKAKQRGIGLYLPVDVVAADRMAPDAAVKTVPVGDIPATWMALDIGPETSRRYAQVLHDAKTIVWNGPMGVFEMDAFSSGTMAMARSVADSGALSVVGGGDTVAAVQRSGQAHRVDYISTGGGAFLTLMEGRTLPAVAALDAAQ